MAPGFHVVAIVAAYNEADIIEQVVADLIEQGVQVYFLDDGSTDGTVAAVERFLGRGLLAVEPLRNGTNADDRFNWARILERKAAVAREVDADWFIHHDADEFRESLWRGVPLGEAIARVDAAGYNAIDFASLDFWPTHDCFRPGDDVRAAFTRYAEREPYDRVQVRAWKRTSARVDLASSGGHDVQFPGRRVFPLRFISRHYPVRSQAHGTRKVLQERRDRFRDEERARGWHVQYDSVSDGASFVRDPSTLTDYDPDEVRLTLALRHRGVEVLESALDEARDMADAHRRELERCSVWARSLEVELQRTAARAAGLDTALADQSGALDSAIAKLSALEAECESRAQAIAGLHAAVREREQRIDDLERSLSWRLTAPARALLRALRGR
jgi:hypothetical protein